MQTRAVVTFINVNDVDMYACEAYIGDVWSVNIKKVERTLRGLPQHVLVTFLEWVTDVEKLGLEEVRKIPGYHDEPLRGKLHGLRSVRLNRAYRAYYRTENGAVKVVHVERVDKHEY